MSAEKLYWYSSLNIIRMITTRTRWTGYIAHTGEMRNA